MTFVTTGLALAGLAAMAIPIIIHLLFRQRRKPVEWAAMRFLLEAFKKHRRRLQLEQLLLLAVRCLILGLLGFALARPLLHDAGLLDTGSSRIVYLIIDNSMTASAMDADGTTALQRHVNASIKMIESLGPSDAVGIFTAAQPVRILLNPPSTDHAGVIRLLRSLEPMSAHADIPGAMIALRGAIDTAQRPEDQVLAYLLSEFRAGSADLDAPLTAALSELGENVQLLAAQPDQRAIANTQLVSIDPVRSVVLPGAADGSGQVTVRLARHGGALDAGVSRVRLELGSGTAVQPETVNWQPGQSEAAVDFLLNIPVTGERELTLNASIDHDDLEADDERFAVLTLRDQLGVLLVDRRQFISDRSIEQMSAGQWVRRALEPAEQSPMEFIEVEPAALSQPDLRGADVMILARPDLLEPRGWTLTRQFVRTGGLLLVLPPAEARVHQWTDALTEYLALPWQMQMEVADHQPPLFFADEQPRDAMLRMLSSEMNELLIPASVYRSLPIVDTAGVGRPLLEFADGSPAMLVATPIGTDSQTEQPIADTGLVVLFTFAPELSWTNIPTKPLMVPLFQELIRQGLSQIRAARKAIVGQTTSIGLPPAAADLLLDDTSFPMRDNGTLEKPLALAGLYTVVDRAQQPLGTLAVNVDPAAGRTQTQSDAAVQSWLRGGGPWEFYQPDNVTAALQQINSGSPIARNILLIVLALIAVETIFARLFSHSGKSRTGSGGAIATSSDTTRRPPAGLTAVAGSGGAR